MRIAAVVLMLVVAVGTSSLSAQQSDNETTGLRVLSYNIKRGLGNDDKTDLARTAAVIKTLNPDLVGLQEVDENAKRSGSVDQAAELGKQLGMHHSFAPFMDYDGGRYGLAVLSKYPIEKSTIVKLPTGNEPRVALVVDVKLPGGEIVSFVCLHFDWVRDDKFRVAQANELKTHLEGLKTPCLVVGDFNDGPESKTLELMRRGMLEAKKPAEDRFTFSSDRPRSEIDFIMMSPPSRFDVKMVDVIEEPMASDHRPLLAEIELKPAQ
ncbi:endonuclease/exonuclease/phosphatase family protein [Lacunimicrobium album]